MEKLTTLSQKPKRLAELNASGLRYVDNPARSHLRVDEVLAARPHRADQVPVAVVRLREAGHAYWDAFEDTPHWRQKLQNIKLREKRKNFKIVISLVCKLAWLSFLRLPT